MQINHKTTIVLNTCDAYSDVLPLFFAALNEYWPTNNYDIVINSEKKTYSEYNAVTHTYSLNFSSWGARLINTLESIETEFVIMLFDDFLLEDFVRVDTIESAEHFLLSSEETSVVYLMDTKLPFIESSEKNQFVKLFNKCNFRLNSYPGLWRREHLISYTGIYDNPWAWEVFGSYRTFQVKSSFYSLNPNFPNTFSYNYQKGGAIYRGKWVKEVVDHKISKYRLDINTSVRGYTDASINERRSFIWKLNFFLIGYKMIGIRVFEVIFSLIKFKYFDKKSN